MPIDRALFVIRQRLAGQPFAAAPIEQIGVRTLRDQVRVQDRMHFVLDPRAMTNDLIATRGQPTLALGGGVRRPDLG